MEKETTVHEVKIKHPLSAADVVQIIEYATPSNLAAILLALGQRARFLGRNMWNRKAVDMSAYLNNEERAIASGALIGLLGPLGPREPEGMECEHVCIICHKKHQPDDHCPAVGSLASA